MWGRGLALILAAMTVALVMSIPSSAQAAPNGAFAWGQNEAGELGDGSTTGPEECARAACSTTPVAVSELSGVRALAGGEFHALAVLESGTVAAWGRGASGQLGNGKTENSDVPVTVSGLSGVATVAAGSSHSLALLSNGTVEAWGSNCCGELGDGSAESSDVPVAVTGLSGVVAIAAGSNHSLALLSNGTVMAWGENSSGQLGNGTMEKSTVPVPVPGLSGVVAIAAAGEHSLALLGNGTVESWGANGDGQLGDGTTKGSDVPVAVKGLSGVSAIAAGALHSLALLKNRTVMAWGDNLDGQLGDGSHSGPETCGAAPGTPCSKTPVAVRDLGDVTAIAGGTHQSLALLAGGSVMAWGGNLKGELGDGTSTGPEPCALGPCSTTPVAVLTHGGMAGIAAERETSLAFGPPPPAATSLPEFGHCVKVTGKKGAYAFGNCIALAAGHKGAYEWMPGPGPKGKFAGESASSVVLETLAKMRISCSTALLEGEYTGAKTASVEAVLKGCENPATKQECQSAAVAAGELQSPSPAEAELGFITGGEKPVVGLDLKPKSPSSNLWTFECGTPPEKTETGTIEGSVIGAVKKIDVKTAENTLTYKQSAGFQNPERFEGGLKDTLLITSTAGVEKGEKSEEQAGFSGSVTISSEEPIEIKAK